MTLPWRRRDSPSWPPRGDDRMIILLRLLFGLALLWALGCFVAYAVTADQRWRRSGVAIVRWTVIGGLVFFAGVLFEALVWSA